MSYEMPGQAADALGMGIRAARLALWLITLVIAVAVTIVVFYQHGVSLLADLLLFLFWGLAVWFTLSVFLARFRK